MLSTEKHADQHCSIADVRGGVGEDADGWVSRHLPSVRCSTTL